MSGTEGPYEPTQRLDPRAGYPDSESDPRGYGAARAGGRGERRPPAGRARRWGRDVLVGLIGALLGFVIALVVVALGTSDRDTDVEAAANEQRIDALEAELAGRDAQIEELESRLAEAEAAAGERAGDIEAQRQALDERAAALDVRAAALDEREAALERREAEVAERERAAAAGEDDPEPDEPGDLLPGIDEETVIERVLEQLRDLFERS